MAGWYLTDGKHWASYRKESRKGAYLAGKATGAYVYPSKDLAEAELKRCAGVFHKLSVVRVPVDKTSKNSSATTASLDSLRQENLSRRRAWTPEERREVYRKTEGHCYICGEFVDWDFFEIDHYIPLSHGGVNRIENLFCTCYACNQLKACMEPDDFFPLVAKIAKYQEEKKKKK